MKTHSGSLAIIGAGPGGLAVAAALKKLGLRADVYEQAHQFSRVGAGINVSPNASIVLKGLGLLDTLRAISHEPPAWRSCQFDTGEIIGEFSFGKEAETTYGAPFLQMHRADLHGALADAVPREWIHLGKKLIHLDSKGSRTALHFEDGSTVYADAVIAADGIHSHIRESINGADKPSFTGRVAYRTVISKERISANIAPFVKWWGPDRHIVIYYINRREVYFVTSVPAGEWRLESWSARGDVDELRTEFKNFHPDVQSVLQACDEVYKWALYDRNPVKPWYQDNIVLMGDACHPMTPYMAQGAAMALEDAVVLARCIHQSEDWSAAFRLFEALRFERTGRVQLESRSNKFMQNKEDPAWLYSYNAWDIPLSVPGHASGD